MTSALPGLNESFAKPLADRRISFGRLPAIFRPELFQKPNSPYSPISAALAATESYSSRRLLSEILSAADDPAVTDAESYFLEAANFAAKSPDLSTLADCHRYLLSFKGICSDSSFPESQFNAFADSLLERTQRLNKRTLALDVERITAAFNRQRKIAKAPPLTKKETAAALTLLPAFQASYIEHLLDEMPSESVRAFYRALLQENKNKPIVGNLPEVLLTRYDRFFNSRIRRAIRQFRGLLVHIGSAARLNNKEQVSRSYAIAEELVHKLSDFGAFSLDERFSLNPIDECYLIWQTDKVKIPAVFREGYEDGIVRALSTSTLVDQDTSSRTYHPDLDFNPICLQLKDGSELILTQTGLIVNEELFSFSGIDTVFYCASPVRLSPNDPATCIHCFGLRTFDKKEKRFRFEEESEWADFSQVFKEYAFPLIAAKTTERLRLGGRISFKNVRITDIGIELPQRQQFWGSLSFVSYAWKDVFIEFSDRSIIFHAGSEKAYVDTWEEDYITNLYPLLKQQSSKGLNRLSEQKPIFELQARFSW